LKKKDKRGKKILKSSFPLKRSLKNRALPRSLLKKTFPSPLFVSTKTKFLLSSGTEIAGAP